MSQSPQRAHNVVILSQSVAAPDNAGKAAAPAAPAALAENRTVGARLAAARLARGLSLDEVRAGTKVKIVHLEAIEAGDNANLPATPFAAGFVKAYAQFLGLDPDEFARDYRAEREPAAAPAELPAGPTVAPLAAAAATAPGPEKLVAYFGIGATIVAVLWITVLAIAPHKELAAPVGDTIAALRADRVAAPAEAAASEAPAPVVIAEPPPAAAETLYTDAEAAAPASPAPVSNPAAETRPVETQEAPPVPRRKTPPAPEAARVAAIAPPAVEPQAIEPQAIEPTAAQPNAGVAPPPLAPSVPEATTPVAAEESAPAAAAEAAPAAPEQAAAPVSKDPVIVAAEVTRSVAAKYPEGCARGAADVETVRIGLNVTADGRPDNPRVVESSNDCFDAAALAAARRMRFSPRLVDGAPSAEAGRIVTVRFAQ